MPPTQPQPPLFLDHTPDTIKAAADRLINALRSVWDRVSLIAVTDATFENAVRPLIDEENSRQSESRVIYFLSSASPSRDIRVAAKYASTLVTQASIQQLTREDVFHVVSGFSQRLEARSLPSESQLYVEKLLHEFMMNGLGLEDVGARERLKRDNLRLVEVLKEYIANLNADTSGLWLSLEELDGLPPNAIERIKEKEECGKYWVNFKTPNRDSMLDHSRNAAVRRRYYTAWDNRMKEANGSLLTEMLELRHNTARALGFDNFAEYRDAERMLSTTEASKFLSDTSSQLLDLGHKELDQLASLKETDVVNLPQELKDESSSSRSIFRWDFGYYKRMAKDDKSIETWHPDVMAIAMWDETEGGVEFLGYLYIDPYPREGKYGHVGHYGLQQGFTRPDGTRHYPSSCLMLNYTPPTATRPSLLDYKAVVSCFHEMGHAIHHLTSRSAHARFHQNTPRDFLEIPSRMLEHFFYDKNIIRAVSCHYEHPDEDIKLPEEAIEKLIATRYDNVASTKLGDLTFAKFDLAVHTTWDDPATRDLSVLLNKLRHEFSLLSGPEDLGLGYDTLHGQTHIRFIHGYGASYYSYLLADAFSTDMFLSKFKPLLTDNTCSELNDIINNNVREEGRRYRRAILEPGSTTGDELGLLRKYLGCDPDPNMFVRMLSQTTSKP